MSTKFKKRTLDDECAHKLLPIKIAIHDLAERCDIESACKQGGPYQEMMATASQMSASLLGGYRGDIVRGFKKIGKLAIACTSRYNKQGRGCLLENYARCLIIGHLCGVAFDILKADKEKSHE